MLSQHETLIGGVDDERVVHLASGFKMSEESPEIIVDTLYAPEKFFQVGVVGKAGVFLIAKFLWIIVFGEFIGKPFW